MTNDLKMCTKLTKKVIKNGFDKTINDLTKVISKDSSNLKLYFYRGMLYFQNNNFDEASKDLDKFKQHNEIVAPMRDYMLKSSQIFMKYVKNNPDIDYASKFINISRAEDSSNFAYICLKDKESRNAVKQLKELKTIFKKENRENRKILVKTMYKLYHLCKSNKYDKAIIVCNKAMELIGNHPYLVEYIEYITNKMTNCSLYQHLQYINR